MMKKTKLTKELNNRWQNHCRVCEIGGILIALPYEESMLSNDYMEGATKSAMIANAFIDQLLVSSIV